MWRVLLPRMAADCTVAHILRSRLAERHAIRLHKTT